MYLVSRHSYCLSKRRPANDVPGRPPLSSSTAWQLHGCYKVGSVKYADFPADSALYGCEDDNISLDHRDPSHPVRNIIKRMFEMRENYPALNDGYYLQQLSNHTHNIYLPGSNGTRTETGLWSVYRSGFSEVQNFTGIGQGDQLVWLLYTNENQTIDYSFNCSDNTSLISPFVEGVTVKNLFAPYEEYTLEKGPFSLGIDGNTEPNGCLSEFRMPPWGFKALVPTDKFVSPRPALTAISPGHDYRMLSTVDGGETVEVKFGYSREMNCSSISDAMQIKSTVYGTDTARIDRNSVRCSTTNSTARWVGEPETVFIYEADLVNVHHGVHSITISNASSIDGSLTNSVDRILLRRGGFDNPMVYPRTANYSTSLLFGDDDGGLYVSHHAPGADLWRYSLNFGTTWSDWLPYTGDNSTLAPKIWSGTKDQDWKGDHVQVQYWGALAGSSDHYQHGDVDWDAPRRFPNLWIEGPFNQWGYDAGVANGLDLTSNGTWIINFQAEWPTAVSLSAWGVNPDGEPDVTQIFGDIDGGKSNHKAYRVGPSLYSADGVLDRTPERTLLDNVINITQVPRSPHLAYRLEVHDGSFTYQLIPTGSRWVQVVLYFLLALLPILMACGATIIYLNSFYQVKFNEYGVLRKKRPWLEALRPRRHKFQPIRDAANEESMFEKAKKATSALLPTRPPTILHSLSTRAGVGTGRALPSPNTPTVLGANTHPSPLAADAGAPHRRLVLIATMEYDIEDWNIKIKIGGLGVMASLMGKSLGHQDLIWVVPCVGGVDYPEDDNEHAEPMSIKVLDQVYLVQVRTHMLRNITYVLLDAPVFRKQTKEEPYPPRMDDFESAVYYSAWNSCIAEAIRRYKPDLYHINDYHGSIAPLHLLPDTIPCALSLHNAEFQGLWPMRTRAEKAEVYKIYNLDAAVVQEYVQFGEVFNLLHGGASYLRRHQKGFGAVGVSKKYGKRSFARYPILWGLRDVGSLPNPDPSDVAEWQRGENKMTSGSVTVNVEFEASRAGLRRQAQEWAGLQVDGSAELFVFVGRWSIQKGVDLIADIFPTILEKHPKTQLICIGPIIDLYGKFAAVKLTRMMKQYPGRVFSKPEFTVLPPYIFSGAEFTLIPSRDEPFGLVAVEFGRKGALGVGARVGGLGQMPGWWYTIESTSSRHLLNQFKGAIEGALASRSDARAILRARSGNQRFPVAQWVQDLETLQDTAVKTHRKYSKKQLRRSQIWSVGSTTPAAVTGVSTPTQDGPASDIIQRPALSRAPSSRHSMRSEIEHHESADWPLRDFTENTLPLRTHSSRLGPGLARQRSANRDNESVGGRFEYYFDAAYSVESFEDGMSRDLQRPGKGSRVNDSHQPDFSRFLQDTLNDRLRSAQPGLDRRSATFESETDTAPNSALPSPGILSPATVPTTPVAGPQQGSPLPFCDCAPLDEPPRYSALLSSDAVAREKKDFNLQRVDPFFTDPQRDYQQAFERRIASLNGKNTYSTIIEEFIVKSEKDWFNRLRGAKMGKSNTPVGSIFQGKGGATPAESIYGESVEDLPGDLASSRAQGQFLLADDYKPPTGVKRFMLRRIGDWPLYSLFLALVRCC